MTLALRPLALAAGVVALAATALTWRSWCQEAPAPGADAQAAQAAQAEWLAKMQPVQQHRDLARFEGDFEVRGKAWSLPGQPPQDVVGTSRLRMVLGDRYLQERFESDSFGAPFQGIGLTGFDTVENRFFVTWFDSMTTFPATMKSEPGAASDAIAMKGDVPCAGAVRTRKIVMKAQSPGSHVSEFFEVLADGTETKTMELTYTKTATPLPRKKKGDDGG
jgi:hypothetical protein